MYFKLNTLTLLAIRKYLSIKHHLASSKITKKSQKGALFQACLINAKHTHNKIILVVMIV